MGSLWQNLVVDAQDPARLARWWAEALGYQIVNETPDEVEIRRAPQTLPAFVFVPAAEGKTVRNRLRLELRPDDREAEIERLVDMGARHVDGEQPVHGPGTVLADPEGNEFCLLHPAG